MGKLRKKYFSAPLHEAFTYQPTEEQNLPQSGKKNIEQKAFMGLRPTQKSESTKNSFTAGENPKKPGIFKRFIIKLKKIHNRRKEKKIQKKMHKKQSFLKRLKLWVKNRSLRASFIYYVITWLFIGIVMMSLLVSFFQNWQYEIYYRYLPGSPYDYSIRYVTDGEIYFRDDRTVNTGVEAESDEIEQVVVTMGESDAVTDKILKWLINLSIPGTVIVCSMAAAVLFYRNKLKEPIVILDNASTKIAQNDLDFKIHYDVNDEMGRLCSSFEVMRGQLQENNREMWRQMEERKRLNAAFSHDLRTPLTVLKGQTELLQKYLPEGKLTQEKVEDTVATMGQHIARLENYVTAMNQLQKLEDIPIHHTAINSKEFVKQLRETGEILCSEKELELEVEEILTGAQLQIDSELCLQVYENLISNAVRFAREKIKVQLKNERDILYLTVQDDGQGFSEQDLEMATNPFYKSKENIYDTHFGLGLNICKILCERHGGKIQIGNGEGGGGKVTVSVLQSKNMF